GGEDHPAQPHASIHDFGKEFHFDGFYSRDNWIACTVVGLDDRESALSQPLFVPQAEEALRGVVDANQGAYIPVMGNPDTCMMMFDLRHYAGDVDVAPYGLRCPDEQYRDYRPRATGCALTADGSLVVADGWNHQIAWYDRGRLVRLVGNPKRQHEANSNKPGQLNEPTHTPLHVNGHVYVADPP